MPTRAEDAAQYSFAVEYKGPPVSYDLPKAVPINVERIPVAAVVGNVSVPANMSLPVVQPVLAPGSLMKTFSKELKSTVSPTSVIAFDRSSEDDTTKELEGLESATVSPTSVIGFEERAAVESVAGAGAGGGGLSGELSSSGALEFSERLNYRSGELSDLNSDSNRLEPDWASSESVLSLDYPSSRVSSTKAVDCEVKRPPVVTFRDIESEEDDGGEEDEAEVVAVKPERKGKKKSCYRCLKGTRFTEKEVCIVCDAKYCSSCVLRAMGSMPEGRKCVGCIGFPIDESKRGCLGKCSRMLKRLLNDLEVRQVMKAEKFCEANQLPPDYICVNGQPLCHEELVLLQTCSNPPKKLKPGNYWYDKVSGLWGKEGQKPSKVISPHLSVGGPIKANASNGNTQVFINGREITKVEHRMLQLAGVQCAGNPHFWVNEDGSYQEEGQKNTKGYIWGKAGTKLVCAVLSLPVPSKSSNPCGDSLSYVGSGVVPDYIEQRILQKILLVGYNGSGTSTIFKQAKILYKAIPFSEDERENIKFTIQSNVYGYLGILLEGRERFEEETLAEIRSQCSSSQTDASGNNDKTLYSIGPRLRAFSDWLLKTMVSGDLEAIFPAATREYAPLVEELWNDSAIQATYKRRNELEMLPSVATYFIERAVDILRVDYEPSDLDILYAEGVTSSNGLACVEFSFPQLASEDSINNIDQQDSLLRYQLIRVNARGLGENCKWLEMFEDVGMVIFCVSLSDYDQFSVDGNGSFSNKMLQTRSFFESMITHPTFEQMDFLLILNKFDVFEEKVERVPLTQCDWFDDFHPVVSRHRSNGNNSSNNINSIPSLGHLAAYYIGVKFKRLYSSLTGKKLYVSLVKGLQPNSVDAALKYSREILKWDEERGNFSFDYSAYSTEASSYSH
ncbi:hypothetical protein ACLB2K_001221 [Fragaria x ananassa]